MTWRKTDRIDPAKIRHEITADELANDVHAGSFARMALIERMDERQIVEAIRGLEATAARHGDQTGSSGPARAALILIAALAAKRQRASAPPPS
jgi:hypothetical protein